MIQFECPHCAAILRVPDTAMGQRGTCPKCKQSLLVPSLEDLTAQRPEPDAAAATPSAPAATATAPRSVTDDTDDSEVNSGPDSWLASNPTPDPPKSSEEAVGELLSALHAPASQRVQEDPLLSVTRRSNARNKSSVVTAVVFLFIAAALGMGAYIWMQPKMQGTLTAERVTDDGLKPIVLSPKILGHGDAFRQFLETHADDRININSQLLRASLEPIKSGLQVQISPAGGSDIYRVNVLKNKALQQYHLDNYRELEKQRLAQIQDAAGEFFAEIEEAEEVLRGNPANLLQYRDRLILPAGVDALGFRLAAFVETTMYPCIWQDKDDRLYFVVPKGTKRFEIREREVYGQPRQFPANLKFVVVADTVGKKSQNEYDYDHMWGGEQPPGESEGESASDTPASEKDATSDDKPADMPDAATNSEDDAMKPMDGPAGMSEMMSDG